MAFLLEEPVKTVCSLNTSLRNLDGICVQSTGSLKPADKQLVGCLKLNTEPNIGVWPLKLTCLSQELAVTLEPSEINEWGAHELSVTPQFLTILDMFSVNSAFQWNGKQCFRATVCDYFLHWHQLF